MSIYEHFEHAQNSALHEIQTLVLICQHWVPGTRHPLVPMDATPMTTRLLIHLSR